jgi:hypothetical protein
MNAPTSNRPSQPPLPGFMSPQRHVSFTIIRIVVGVAILATMPWAGTAALFAVVPLAWAAGSIIATRRARRSGQTGPAASAAR